MPSSPLLAAAGVIAKIAHSVNIWSTRTPQGRATLAAAYQQKIHRHSKLSETAVGEATKQVGERIVRPAADSLYKHVRNDLNQALSTPRPTPAKGGALLPQPVLAQQGDLITGARHTPGERPRRLPLGLTVARGTAELNGAGPTAHRSGIGRRSRSSRTRPQRRPDSSRICWMTSSIQAPTAHRRRRGERHSEAGSGIAGMSSPTAARIPPTRARLAPVPRRVTASRGGSAPLDSTHATCERDTDFGWVQESGRSGLSSLIVTSEARSPSQVLLRDHRDRPETASQYPKLA